MTALAKLRDRFNGARHTKDFCVDADLMAAAFREIEALATPKVEVHPDDQAVDRFAAAMRAKLARKRDEGRGGWEDTEQCTGVFLSQLLREHVEKGDPLDVGNLAMMLHQRGEGIAPAPKVEAVKPVAEAGAMPGTDGFTMACFRAEDVPIGTPLYTSPVPDITDEAVERAAKHITEWMGFSWDGLLDGRVTDKGFPVFTHGQFGWGFQGHKGDMLDLARAAFPSSPAIASEDIERAARALDPEIWEVDAPTPTRAATEDFHARRNWSIETARTVLAAAFPRRGETE